MAYIFLCTYSSNPYIAKFPHSTKLEKKGPSPSGKARNYSMATSSCYPFKTPHFCSSLSVPKTQFSSIPSQQIHTHQLCFSLNNPGGSWLRPERRIGCVKGGPARELERELEEEMNVIISEEDEWVGVGSRWREKCEGSGGIVELMECLEREAIMGDDEGREPTDYNRRAQIFYTSSRVFQALKESNSPPPPPPKS